MAAPFPTALQRTSDERWVTLDVVAREQDRALARILEAPQQAAVVRVERGQPYDRHLRDLLSSPPPDPGPGVHLAWPIDLLHDLDARAIGYAAERPGGPRTVALADFVDPRTRAKIAPMATRRHLLRVARNVATATAAIHHSGHGKVRGRQFRLDDRARVVVVRADELIADATPVQMADDERRLGYLVIRLLGGRPWASDGDLAALIRRAGDPRLPPTPAQEWFFALREAERALPKGSIAAPATDAGAERLMNGTDLATALAAARRGGAQPVSSGGADAHGRPSEAAGSGKPSWLIDAASLLDREGTSELVEGHSSPTPQPRAGTTPQPSARTPQPLALALALAAEPSASTALQPLAPEPHTPEPGASTALQPSAPAPPSATSQPRTSASAASVLTSQPSAAAVRAAGRVLDNRAARERAEAHASRRGLARPAFAVAAGLAFGGLASVAPFAVFAAVACLMIVRAAVDVGRRKATLGPHQTVAITMTRLIPFATGGLALGAFILLDLLLVLGLVMALAERLFDYGPGFTLTWILQLPEVSGLVRVFALLVGAFGGLALGGQTYDRIRLNAGDRRMITTPAVAMALAIGILAADASIVWWPLPLVA